MKKKFQETIKNIEASSARSQDPGLTDGQRKSVLARLDYYHKEAKDIKDRKQAERERECRDREAVLDASLKLQQEAYNVVESLVAQRVYLARRGDNDGKKLLDSVKADLAKPDFTLKAKALVTLQSIKAGLVKGPDMEKELQATLSQVREKT